MDLQVCVLGSGSSGNCTYIGTKSGGILVDAGLSGKEIERRLGQIGLSFGAVLAICVSHEHSDHTSSLGILQRKYGLPVYANAGTIEGLKQADREENLNWKVFTTGAGFNVGDLLIEPFGVPHDAYEPVGFVVKKGEQKVAIVTDVGMPTTLLRERLKNCAAIIIESNHDVQLLQASTRPWRLKQRIHGRQGHLSNDHASQVLAEVAGPQLQQVFLAHISSDCNKPDLALRSARKSLDLAGYSAVKICSTAADTVSEVWRYNP